MIPNLSFREAILAVALCMTASATRADTPTSFVAAVLEDVPEGLAVDRHGDLYATLLSKGQVVRLRKPGRPEVVAQVLPADTASGATLGIDFGGAVKPMWQRWSGIARMRGCRENPEQSPAARSGISTPRRR
jgi:hypothetical protein